MRKRFFFLLFFSAAVSALLADIRTPEQAATIASGYLQAVSNGSHRAPAAGQEMMLLRTLYKTDLDWDESQLTPNAAPARKTHIDNDETEPALYMFNNDTEGFVVVSADTRATDVLAYSLTGTLTDDNLAPGFMWLMERFVEEISSLTDNEMIIAGEDDRAPIHRAPQTVTAIEPLLGGIIWGQSTPFNNKCPIDTYDNTRCVTGCVATAAAQIMRYWKWPVSGTGSHSYYWKNQINKVQKLLSQNFSTITFDWDNMLPSYQGDYTSSQANAVATLMYACGVAVNMNYGGNSTAGSGAVTDNMAPAMVSYFGYQYERGLGNSNSSINNNDIYQGTTTYAEAYKEFFNDDLENGRPILMSGGSTGGGHAFVCDGRDRDNYFHINWGWTGASNCYTPLTAIRPGYPKHNDLYFTTRMYATYGLRPNTTCINTKENTTVSETEDNLPYVWRERNITESGVYEDVVTNSETGCTTTYVLYFTVRPAGTDGMCGDNLFYTYNTDTHTLTITGTGTMWEYDYLSTPGRKTPWYDYASDIQVVNLPEGMTSISAFAFAYCSNLTSITIPSTITSIGAQPFFGCTALAKVTFNQTTPPALGGNCFQNISAEAIAYVPCGSIPAYEATEMPFAQYRSHCGYCEENDGTNLEWEYAKRTLTITGEGNMETYAAEEDMPWYSVRDQIETVSLSDEANQQPLLSWLSSRGETNITLRRTLWADGYLNTLCLPFSLTASEVQTYLPNTELFTFTEAQAAAGELQITLGRSNSITAGVPYLVRFPAEDPDIVNPTFTNVVITETIGQTAGLGEVTFNGILQPQDMTAYNTNQLMVGEEDRLFWADVNDYMKGFRAYFQITASQSSPIRKGMPARVVVEKQTPTDAVETQQGIRATSEKVIQNGQLIIRANGNEYNAQGQKL
ncbi:MAG: C10 family peptidase [Paludibacteraceae bacterium]|nr:C10 family peptidase [Paludibacteraceae bacterium]